jgi:hypothetical protein
MRKRFFAPDLDFSLGILLSMGRARENAVSH